MPGPPRARASRRSPDATPAATGSQRTPGRLTEQAGAGVFNEATALAYTGGDRKLLREVVQLFLSNCPKQVDDLRRAVHGVEGPLVHRAAHALKGTLATLGAERALAVARRLETMGSTDELAGASDACRALEGELEALRKALGAAIKSRASAGRSAKIHRRARRARGKP
ncbi:MAG: Hpt domain-containing protein [Acidobacteria bacterium]|nr:Hpt domain-containing protein [Acidobacteriota bacterium]